MDPDLNSKPADFLLGATRRSPKMIEAIENGREVKRARKGVQWEATVSSDGLPPLL